MLTLPWHSRTPKDSFLQPTCPSISLPPSLIKLFVLKFSVYQSLNMSSAFLPLFTLLLRNRVAPSSLPTPIPKLWPDRSWRKSNPGVYGDQRIINYNLIIANYLIIIAPIPSIDMVYHYLSIDILFHLLHPALLLDRAPTPPSLPPLTLWLP